MGGTRLALPSRKPERHLLLANYPRKDRISNANPRCVDAGGVPLQEPCSRGTATQPVFLLAIRLYWGWQFAQTGWGKLQHLPKVTAFFTDLGIPAPAFSAFAVSWLELAGGILLAVGLGSRFVGLLLAGDMFVAYLTAGRSNLLSFFSDPGKFYSDDAFTFLFAALIVLILGRAGLHSTSY